MTNINFNFLKSGTFWSTVVLILSGAFTVVYKEYPTDLWLGSIVSVLAFISSNYFHQGEVTAAATASAAASVAAGKATPVSGQK
jgi:hypothetical protein